jgi:outer membrane receptor protein involved in Fe transport
MTTPCTYSHRTLLLGVFSLLAIGSQLAPQAQVAQANNATSSGAAALAEELRWLQAESFTITTATLSQETISHAPATVRVVSQRQIRERGYRNLEDLMNDLPGFDIQNHSGLQDNVIAMRGVTGNNKFLILQNGVRINSAVNSPQIPVRDNFPVYNVKQVEVLYGPASAIYGADAFNGVINLITETAEGVDGGMGAFEAGEFGYYRGEFFAGKRLADWAAFSLGGTFLESDNPDLSEHFPAHFRLGDLVTFDGRTIVRAQDRAGYATPNRGFTTYAKLELGEDLVLGWNQSYWRVPSSNNGLPNRIDYGGDPFIAHAMATAYGIYKYEVSDQLHGQVQASYSFYEVDEQSKFVDIFTDFAPGYKYEKGERFQVEPHLTLDLDKHAFTAGLNFEYFSSIPFTADLPTPYDPGKSPDAQNIFYPGSQNQLPVQFFDVDYYNVGGFLQAQSQWTSKFSSTVGVRVDSNSDYGDTVNPRVGLVYEMSEETTSKLCMGRRFWRRRPRFVTAISDRSPACPTLAAFTRAFISACRMRISNQSECRLLNWVFPKNFGTISRCRSTCSIRVLTI